MNLGLKIIFRLFLLFALSLSVSCGFKMRSEMHLPFNMMYTNLDSNSRFGVMLMRMLKTRSPNLKFVDNPKDADIILKTSELRRERTPFSLDALGKVEEYELYLELEFSLFDASNNILLPQSIISSTRIMPYDILQSSASDQESDFLYEDMEREIASKLFGRITASDISNNFLKKN